MELFDVTRKLPPKIDVPLMVMFVVVALVNAALVLKRLVEVAFVLVVFVNMLFATSSLPVVPTSSSVMRMFPPISPKRSAVPEIVMCLSFVSESVKKIPSPQLP